MKRILRFLSLFLAVLALVGLTSGLNVQAQPSDIRAESAIVARAVAPIPTVTVNQLPPEARSTINLIRQGGPFPYPKDGTVFYNRERRLPQAATGYYREYTVKTPGIRGRGARRIIIGQSGEIYYTGNHYSSYARVK